MSTDVVMDGEALREEVRSKYREVATNPGGPFHFHTGRPLASRLGYNSAVVDALPDSAVESFALTLSAPRGERSRSASVNTI